MYSIAKFSASFIRSCVLEGQKFLILNIKNFDEIKKRNGTPKITWKIIRICRSYNPNSKRCLLCLNEKFEIATYKGDNFLNKRTEIINTCRHRSKYKLANCDTID